MMQLFIFQGALPEIVDSIRFKVAGRPVIVVNEKLPKKSQVAEILRQKRAFTAGA